MKVLGSLLGRLGIRLVWAVVEFIANWSLDTVNTNPLAQTTRACDQMDRHFPRNKAGERKNIP